MFRFKIHGLFIRAVAKRVNTSLAQLVSLPFNSNEEGSNEFSTCQGLIQRKLEI